MNDIPDWAGKRACELLHAEAKTKGLSPTWCWSLDRLSPIVRTVAKLVMQHEQPPVDPDEEAVKRILAAWAPHSNFSDVKDHLPENFARAVSQYKQERSK